LILPDVYDPGFRRDLPDLLNGLDAFLPSLMEAEAFFRPQRLRVWEMAEAFLGMGCRIVVIKCGANGQLLLDGASRQRWDVPAYSVQPNDVTGAGDAYCGGFLAGPVETGDPLEAALRGSVSSSLVIEGTGRSAPASGASRSPGQLHAPSGRREGMGVDLEALIARLSRSRISPTFDERQRAEYVRIAAAAGGRGPDRCNRQCPGGVVFEQTGIR
jgi:hypothetical protein